MISKFMKLGISRGLGAPSSRILRAFKHASAVDEPLSHQPLNSTEPFLGSNSGSYVEEMYSAWEADPRSVHLSWSLYFSNLKQGRLPAYQTPPTLMPGTSMPSESSDTAIRQNIKLKTEKLTEKFIELGHQSAKLDPLGLNEPSQMDLHSVGISSKELDMQVDLGPELLPGYFKSGIKNLPLKDVLAVLHKTYCATIGFEYSHISDPKKSQWLQERIESPSFYQNTKQERELALCRLSDAESFERMFATKFATVKRYGVEGGDSMLPALMSIVDQCGEKDVSSVVIGMPHRGRLNVFTNMMGNPAEEVFAEFSGKAEPPHPWSGDSSYHLACQINVKTPSGKEVELSLTANPSHLEAVHPVALGTTRAKQGTGKEAMAIIVHGDAAMAGQGVVYEAMGFHHLPKYETGGSIHLVVNNQIGFTTNPHYSRSTRYCCDIAKMAEAPVLHVNGDDVDAVLAATRLAVEWRQAFRQDIFIDLVCYRKNGHNEVDQPSYTQPKMYAAIAKHVPVLTAYANHLVSEAAVSKDYVDQIQRASWERMEKAYAASRGLSPKSKEWEAKSNELTSPAELNSTRVKCPPTGAKSQHLSRVAEVVSTYPRDFHIHPNLVKVLQARERMAKEGTSIDWATAEQLAFGTLLLEGKSVRISGQDVERGTFSQRHAVLVDQATEARHVPLNQLSKSQGTFHPCNSHLSEFGVLGFELGYSVASPDSLVLWEAQFGDFSNVAQCMIDQFVASGEQKWLQSTGLAILLPHGFDGNGPEHSSGRLERYLQLTDEDPHSYPEAAMQHQKINWSVVSCTTPANYFHALRRQVHRPFRKPLVCFNGKGLLRHPLARSTTDDLQEDGPGFQSAYPEQFTEEILSPQEIRTHILCTGQVYLRLLRARQQNNIKDVAISRIEELAPFPFDHVARYCKSYPNAEIVWCQEEPVNMGAYSHVLPRIETALNHHQLTLGSIRYAGRTASAAVAVGNKTRHLQEDHALISSALFGAPRPVQSIVNGVPVF